MSEALVPVAAVDRPEIARPGAAAVALPEVIVDAGPAAVERFLEFFAAAIANDRTRAAYGQAAGQFLGWCGARGLGLRAIAPLHVAAYIRTHPGSVPTVKQHLAAIRALLDWLVVHQVLPVNPAASVRGPKHVVTKGATPVLTPAETRSLLDRIDTGTLVGLRDRALLSVLVYSFARVSAAVGMRRQDYFRQGTRGWLRLHEKGGKRHDVPAHHRAEEAVEAYLAAAGGIEDVKAPLFQSVDRAGGLSGRPLGRRAVLAMIKRRASAAGLPASTCCHTFRGDGDHGVPVERRDARARATDRRPRVAEDGEAVRPDGGHDHARRDRTHRDLGETRRAGPVQGQVVSPSSSTTPPSSRGRRGERAVTRWAAGRAAVPRGLRSRRRPPRPAGSGERGLANRFRAGGTDRACPEGGARDGRRRSGGGSSVRCVSRQTAAAAGAGRAEPVRATGYGWAVRLRTPGAGGVRGTGVRDEPGHALRPLGPGHLPGGGRAARRG